MKNTIEIKTRISPNLSSRKQWLAGFTEQLNRLTVDDLKTYYVLFLGEKPKGLNKMSLVSALLKTAAFKDEKSFRDWFFRLPVLTQNLLYRLSFDYYVPAQKLEEELGLSLVREISTYYWDEKWAFHEELGIGFLRIHTQYNKAFVVLPYILRMILVDWLVPPPELSLENCLFSGDAAASVWDNSGAVNDSLPLLFDALADFLGRAGPLEPAFRYIRGFKKNELDGLRASSGFKLFDGPQLLPETKEQKTRGRASPGLRAGDLVPDSADLTARFILAMKNFSIARPKNGQKEVKNLVSAFFSDKSQYESYSPPDRHSLEFNVLFDHISKPSSYSLRYEGELPYARKFFQDILVFCAKDGGTFDADKVARFIYRNAQYFSFYFNDTERHLKYRADTIIAEGIQFSSYNSEFYPGGVLQYYLLTAPLLKAYCYLFAALGLLEISQSAPPLDRILNEKNRPFSPYDSLKSFRVTEFGKWCLGLTEKCPEPPKAEYQAIADKELLLVTVQGNSLERTVYLDRIGRKLGGQAEKKSRAESGAGSGTDRWRVSPDSFIAGCTDKSQIEDRINKFKALIDPAPAPHWLALFEKALNRAGLFDRPLDDMLVYPLPADRGVTEELLRDTELRSLVHRAEGGFLAVPLKNKKKFFALLNIHGIAVFDN
ncbi:MAG: hypothetical protein LBT87_06435 [Treponema sp.]|jgi:hypothetical protein|nr:hypothetical protein [Treponema sp.]